MPQLPSGRHIGLDPRPLGDLVKNAEDSKFVHQLMMIKHPEDAFRHIGVLYFREKTSGEGDAPLSPLSNIPPEESESYPSGFNLITIKTEYEAWSEEDRAAFLEFLRADRTNRFMDDALGAIREAQQRLLDNPSTLPGMLAVWWRLGIHPLQEPQDHDDCRPEA